jgi:hypothetical protein
MVDATCLMYKGSLGDHLLLTTVVREPKRQSCRGTQ